MNKMFTIVDAKVFETGEQNENNVLNGEEKRGKKNEMK